MSNNGCPTREELAAFVLGTLSETALAAVAQHLDDCQACEVVVTALESLGDPLIAGLRQSGGTSAKQEVGAASREVPAVLGDFRIVREIGRGGMGIVYEAEQISLGRHVALKILPATTLIDRGLLKRFQREAKSAAGLHHTNIVPVYGVGESNGLHYLVMQLIQGRSLDHVVTALRQQRARRAHQASPPDPGGHSSGDSTGSFATPQCLTPDEGAISEKDEGGRMKDEGRQESSVSSFILPPSSFSAAILAESGRAYWRSVAEIGIQVAEALASAHAQGILHRDVKPANLLLDGQGRVWITDFGLAKAVTDQDGLTMSGDIIGTIRYMAPERFSGIADARSDIYSVGLTLYELLALRPAFDELDKARLLPHVMHGEPPRPSRFAPDCPRDLETIVLKSIARDPNKRYPIARQMAEDLRRFLDDRPIRARRVGIMERLWRVCKRNPLPAILIVGLVVVFMTGFAGVTINYWRAEDSLEREKEARTLAEQREQDQIRARREVQRLTARLALDHGLDLCEHGEIGRGLLLLAHALERAVEQEDTELERTARSNLALWRRHFIRQRAFCPHPEWVHDVCFSPDQKTFLTACHDGAVRRWSTDTGRQVGKPLLHPSHVGAVAFSPDGKTILTGSGTQTGKGEARLWDADSGKLLGKPLSHPSGVVSVAFSPNGKHFLTVCRHQAQLWTKEGEKSSEPRRHKGGVLNATFSRDGRWVVTGGVDGTARLWTVPNGLIGPSLRQNQPNNPAVAVAMHPAGRLVAIGGADGIVQLWDVQTTRPVGAPMRHHGLVGQVAFSPDGKLLATGIGVYTVDVATRTVRQVGGEARLWDAGSGVPLGMPLPHPLTVSALAFSPTSDLLMTGCEDGVTRLFATHTGLPFGNPLPGDGTVKVVAFSRDGRTAVSARAGRSASLWQMPAGQGAAGTLLFKDKSLTCVAFSPNNSILAAGGEDGSVYLWDFLANRPGRVFSHPARLPAFLAGEPRQIESLAWSPAGDVLLAGQGKWARLWQYPSGKLKSIPLADTVVAVAYRGDGKAFLTGQRNGVVQLHDPAGNLVTALLKTGPSLRTLAFGAAGRTACVANGQAEVQCWDLSSRKIVQVYRHPGPASVVAVSGDGQTVLTGGLHERLGQLGDAESGTAKGVPLLLDGDEHGLAGGGFSSDGSRMLMFAPNRARLWDRHAGKPLGPALSQALGRSWALGGDGNRVAAAGKRGLRLWQLQAPLAGSPQRLRIEVEALAGLHLDHDVIRPLSEEAVQQRLRQLPEERRERLAE